MICVLSAVKIASADDYGISQDISSQYGITASVAPSSQAQQSGQVEPPKDIEPWHIDAKKLTFYQSTNVILGEGAVNIQRGNLKISADRMLYDTQNGKVWANGAVVITLENDTINGEEGEFDLKTSTGSIKGAHLFLKRNNVHLIAKQLWKTGTEEYKAEDAVISTCPLPKQAWSFRCRDLVLTITGQAVATNTRFNIENIPVLYSPWISIPINRYRRSGFLLPYFATSSRNGAEINAPYFWAINDNMDATFYQHPMSNRGWMEGMEFRHVFSPESMGIMRYNHMIDTLKDNDYNNDGQIRGNADRWWLRGKINQELPLGFQAKADIDYISDRDYLQEFDRGPMGYDQTNRTFLKNFGRGLADKTDTIRPSSLQITRNGEDNFIGSEIRYNNNLVIGEQASTIQTLPRFIFHGFDVPFAATGLYCKWDASYVNYWRDTGTKEQRIHLEPALSLPFKLKKWANGLATGSIEETIYMANGSSQGPSPNANTHRSLYTFTTEMATNVGRTFDLGDGAALQHTIRPKLVYTYRPTVDQKHIPFIDNIDRLDPLNRVTWSVLSFLSSKKSLGKNRYAFTDVMRFYAEQSYDTHGIPSGPPEVQNYSYDIFNRNTLMPKNINTDHKFSDIYGEIDYWPLPYWYIRYDTTYNIYGDGFTSYNLWSGVSRHAGENLALSYRYNRIEKINSFDINAMFPITETWRATYRTSWSVQGGNEVESVYGLRYQASCWAITCDYKKNKDESIFGFNIELLGIGGWGGD
ncbi:MAG: LPS-assembly protein LptD [Dissulfurimicrobium sp.]|uniref:LPS-assembly protein LptD n=1 Tax=Dissulfurimicrobium sp. TaxID=2022436 RepID=UPI00404901D4